MENKEVKKQLYVGRIVLSLVISFFLFIGVFSFGYFIAFENYQSVVAEQDQIYNSLISLQLEKEIIKISKFIGRGKSIEKSVETALKAIRNEDYKSCTDVKELRLAKERLRFVE